TRGDRKGEGKRFSRYISSDRGHDRAGMYGLTAGKGSAVAVETSIECDAYGYGKVVSHKHRVDVSGKTGRKRCAGTVDGRGPGYDDAIREYGPNRQHDVLSDGNAVWRGSARSEHEGRKHNSRFAEQRLETRIFVCGYGKISSAPDRRNAVA